MQIIVTDRQVETIQIIIETPHELRALYILLQIIARPEFKLVRNAIASFDDIPALGRHSKEDTIQNPVKRLYNLMTCINEKTPTRSQLAAIITACKKAVNDYNHVLTEFYNSDIIKPNSDIKLPSNFLRKVTSIKKVFSKEEFMSDTDILQRLTTPALREAAYLEYEKFATLIEGFSSIDPNRSVSLLRMLDEFKILSDEIYIDDYMNDASTKTAGITTNWYAWSDFHCSPSVFGSICGIGAGLVASNLKSYYDEHLTPIIDNDEKYYDLIFKNTYNTFDAIGVMFFGRYCAAWKTKRDDDYKKSAIAALARAIPAYESLLKSKGEPYDVDEITHTTSSQIPAPQDAGNDDHAALLPPDDRALRMA